MVEENKVSLIIDKKHVVMGNNELDITMGENANHCAYFDLGSGSVSDTKWTLRFKYQIRTYTASSSCLLYTSDAADE